MRYLFGDAAEFPVQYNVLATLRGFLECGGRACQLHHETGLLEATCAKRLVERAAVLDEVERYCRGVGSDAHGRAEAATAKEAILPIAAQLGGTLVAIVEEAKGACARESQAERTRKDAEVAARRREIARCIETFLTREVLPVRSTSFSMRVGGERAGIAGTHELEGGITAAFELDPVGPGDWGETIKVQRLAPETALQVGLKKKFLSKNLAPEVVLLDEYMVTGVDLGPASCDVALRRKPDSTGDDFMIEMRQGEGGFSAQIRRMDETPPSTQEAASEDHAKLRALWSALSERSAPALQRKRRLLWVRLDGKDVFESDLVIDLVDRIIDQLAPLVGQIAEHSPNKTELSLKIDRGEGRREEIYLRKSELARHVADLPDELFQRFAVLDIFTPGELEADLKVIVE